MKRERESQEVGGEGGGREEIGRQRPGRGWR